jgi:hypothetical protein
MEPRTEIIPVKLANGRIAHAQVTALGGEEEVATGILPFEDVAAAIEGIVGQIAGTLEKVKPRKASVEFGIEVATEAGKLTALLVKGSGTASMKITLEWGSE